MMVCTYRLRTTMSIIVILAVSGCSSGHLAEYAARFGDATTEATATISAVYLSINDLERDQYINRQVVNRQRIDEKGDGDLIKPVLSIDALSVRMSALREVGRFAEVLVAVAASDAPENAAANVRVLGERFNALSQKAGGGQPVQPITGVLSGLGALFTRIALEERRDAALRTALRDGSPKIRELLDTIERDMRIAVELQRTSADQLYTGYLLEYNRNYLRWSRSERQAAAERLRHAAKAKQVADAFNPASSVESMRMALEALTEYAKNGDEITTLDEILALIGRFEDDVITMISLLNTGF